MPESWSASSSCASSILFEEVPAVTPPSPRASTDSGVIKFLCSYGGKILPRRHDGKLRYVGGHTRVLTVHRPLHFHGLYKKLRELCGWDAVSVRCQLPAEDMDALVSVTSHSDLASVLDEYYDVAASRQNRQLRMIRVFLDPPARARTPRVSSTPLLASRRRRPPGYALMHATGAGPSRPVRFILLPPIAPVSPPPSRPQLFCFCQ